MPLIQTTAAPPTGANAAPDKIAVTDPPTCLVNLADAGGVDVLVQASNACSVRPYFWRPVPGHVDGGAWVPLGGDAVDANGTAPVSADPIKLNGCAHARYQDSEGGRSWILCHVTGAPGDLRWAILEATRRAAY